MLRNKLSNSFTGHEYNGICIHSRVCMKTPDFVAIVPWASVYNWDEYWEVGGEVASKLGCLEATSCCLRAETCCGQLSSPFLPSRLTPPYSPIAATSLQNCTNILDYPAPRRYLVFSVVAVERFRFPLRTRRRNSHGRRDNNGVRILNTNIMEEK